MPDIGLIELILIGIVAFMVLGPERLPEFFSQIAGFVRQGRDWIDSLKKQMDEEKGRLTSPLNELKSDLDQAVNSTVKQASGEDHG